MMVASAVTTWTVRYQRGGFTHYKTFESHDEAAAFADWWSARGAGFGAVVLPK